MFIRAADFYVLFNFSAGEEEEEEEEEGNLGVVLGGLGASPDEERERSSRLSRHLPRTGVPRS